ncbi:hypothetical protein PENTCL1PPCAC_15304, partial [Pristionchus entomophagus]
RMSSTIFAFALLLGFMQLSDAKVEFTHSTMYDIYDFEGATDVPLRCDVAGCLIFVSSASESQGYGTDPFVKNLMVYDAAAGQWIQSIADVAAQFQNGTSKEVP